MTILSAKSPSNAVSTIFSLLQTGLYDKYPKIMGYAMQSIRQSNLFLAEDWKTIYKAFREVNYANYDFDTIRQSMIEYIRVKYPEDFNDWIESSEFIAIIDLLAYLGQSLSYRMDLNTRENFLDTVESKEGAIRLARMLSYDPQRNYAATGLVKITSVTTDEPVLDSEDRNLSGIPIEWNSTTNIDWLEQFTLVMNSAFNANNPFGSPTKSGTINSIPTDIYEMNNVLGLNVVYPFNINNSGETFPCELTNCDFTDNGNIFEPSPNPYGGFRVLYRNDSRGNSSPNTGFFMLFKQGTLNYRDEEFSIALENRMYDINNININETDVWVQEIDDNGIIVNDWTKVPTIAASSNIIFNSINRGIRNIFSVVSRENDQVSIRFPDGNFGNIPTGVFRMWYRTSNGLSYAINPKDIQNFTVTIPYYNLIGQAYNLTITYSLQNSVNNSAPAETLESIKELAPIIYYTQDRMVNGEDYNVFPLIRNGMVVKIKASNRTYSGHSRYVNTNDPTSTYQNTVVFSDDGIFYKEYDNNLSEIQINNQLTLSKLISGYIEPAMASVPMLNFVLEKGTRATNFAQSGASATLWRTATQLTNSSTGYFEVNGLPISVGPGNTSPNFLIYTEAMVNLVPISNTSSDGIWVSIEKVVGDGAGVDNLGVGQVYINERIDDAAYIIKQVVPSFATKLNDAERNSVEEQIRLKNTFGLGFNYSSKVWYVIESQDLASANSGYSLAYAENKSGSNMDESWLIRVEYTSSSWKIYSRGIDYIWESVKDVRFFYADDYKAVSNVTGQAVQDQINILKINTSPVDGFPLESSMRLALASTYTYPDGYIEPRRVKVSFYDSDSDGVIDDPDIFVKVVGNGEYIFWENYQSIDGYEYKKPVDVQFMLTSVPTSSVPANPVHGDIAFVYDPNNVDVGAFYVYDGDVGLWQIDLYTYTFNPYGRKDLAYNWKHYASREDRIDPSVTNIIDMFVLPSAYDTAMREWIKSNGDISKKPIAPNSDQLSVQFADLDTYKMITDEMIWRPTKYKVLFGDQAEEELKAIIKIVKVAGVSMTDNEVKTRVISAIDDFFDVSNWNFGETFYFTELAAYIHQRLATIVASVVLVPLNEESAFGNLYQVNSEPDEIFISAAKVNDIQIVDNLTPNALRIGS